MALGNPAHRGGVLPDPALRRRAVPWLLGLHAGTELPELWLRIWPLAPPRDHRDRPDARAHGADDRLRAPEAATDPADHGGDHDPSDRHPADRAHHRRAEGSAGFPAW